MSRAGEYRAKAEEALAHAKGTNLTAKRDLLLQTARAWLEEAERLDALAQMKKINAQADKERQLRGGRATKK